MFVCVVIFKPFGDIDLSKLWLLQVNTGINVRKRQITNISEENVVQPLIVSTSALSLATECVRMIPKIDDIVSTR